MGLLIYNAVYKHDGIFLLTIWSLVLCDMQAEKMGFRVDIIIQNIYIQNLCHSLIYINNVCLCYLYLILYC